MNVRYSEDHRSIEIDLSELAEHMNEEVARDIVRTRFMSKDIMLGLYRHVAGGDYAQAWEGWSLCNEDRQAFREALMPLMDDIAKTAIRHLKREMFQARADARRMEDWAWALRHWNGVGPRPELAGYESIRLQEGEDSDGEYERARDAIEKFESAGEEASL